MIFWILFLTFTLLIYKDIALHGLLLAYDDRLLTTPFTRIHSLSDYFQALQEGWILDRQPVRDLMIWTEQIIYQMTGFFKPHLISVFLWMAVLFVAYHLSQFVIRSANLRKFYILVILCHPTTLCSVAWVASRKHLLAVLFILIATYLLHQTSAKRRWGLILICYVLSVLSQPITLLWVFYPAIFIFTEEYRKNSHVTISLALKKIPLWFHSLIALSFMFILWLNWSYYHSSQFLKNSSNGTKFLSLSLESISFRFTIIGRYFINLIFPVYATTASYNGYAMANYFGLILLFIFIMILFRKYSDRISNDYYPWLYLASVPIILMTARITVHPGWDTYGLLFIIIGIMLLIRLFGDMILNWRVQGAILMILLMISTNHIHSFYSDLNYWKRAVSTDAGMNHKTELAKALIAMKAPYPAIATLVDEIRAEDPKNSDLGYLISHVILRSPLSASEKKRLLKENFMITPWYLLNTALTYLDIGEKELAYTTFTAIFREFHKLSIMELRPQLRQIKKDWTALCLELKKDDCQKIEEYVPESEIIYFQKMYGSAN